MAACGTILSGVLGSHGWVGPVGVIAIVAMSYITICLLALPFLRNRSLGKVKIRALFFTITVEPACSLEESMQSIPVDRDNHPPVSGLSQMLLLSGPVGDYWAALA